MENKNFHDMICPYNLGIINALGKPLRSLAITPTIALFLF